MTTPWTPKLEQLIRDLGEYTDKQMKDLLNPESSTGASVLRIVFRMASGGKSLMKKTFTEAGLDCNASPLANLTKLVALAEANQSDAAAKIKKALPVAEQLTKDFAQQPGGMFKKTKIAKLKKIAY